MLWNIHKWVFQRASWKTGHPTSPGACYSAPSVNAHPFLPPLAMQLLPPPLKSGEIFTWTEGLQLPSLSTAMPICCWRHRRNHPPQTRRQGSYAACDPLGSFMQPCYFCKVKNIRESCWKSQNPRFFLSFLLFHLLISSVLNLRF